MPPPARTASFSSVAQAGRGLARVEDARARALHRLDEARRERGDAGEAAEEVERHALAREDRAPPAPLSSASGPGSRQPPVGRERASNEIAGSTCANTASATSSPAGTPGARCSMVARAVAPAGTTAAVVRSPVPRSSSRARAITSNTRPEATGTAPNADGDSMEERGRSALRLPAVDVRAAARPLRGRGPAGRAKRAARAAGLTTVLCVGFLPLEPVDGTLGDAGWAVAGAGAGSLDAGAWCCSPSATVGWRDLLAVCYGAVAGLAVLNWLSGSYGSALQRPVRDLGRRRRRSTRRGAASRWCSSPRSWPVDPVHRRRRRQRHGRALGRGVGARATWRASCSERSCSTSAPAPRRRDAPGGSPAWTR